jgi:hypothetical protein
MSGTYDAQTLIVTKWKATELISDSTIPYINANITGQSL